MIHLPARITRLLYRWQTQIILLIGEESVQCFTIPRGEHEPLSPPLYARHDDDAARAAILQHCANFSQARVTILINTLAQDYHIEPLPPLTWLDRRRVCARRLAATLPQHPLRRMIELSPTYSLAAGLPALESVHHLSQNWIVPLYHRQPRLALLPLEGAASMTGTQGWHMQLSLHHDNQLRQIVTRDGQFIFTRLTPLPYPYDPALLRSTILATRDYLARFGLTRTVMLTLHASLPPALHQALSTWNDASHHVLVVTGDADHAIAVTVAQHGVHYPLAPAPTSPLYAKTDYLDHKLRRMAGLLSFSCLLTLLVLVVMLGARALTYHAMTQDIATIESAIAAEQPTTTTASRNTQSLVTLRTALDRQRLFAERGVTPWVMMHGISQSLRPIALHLTALDWRHETQPTSAEHPSAEQALLAVHSDRGTPASDIQNALSQNLPDYTVTLQHDVDEHGDIGFSLMRGLP